VVVAGSPGVPLVTGAGAELTEEGDAAEDVCDDAGLDSADVDAEGDGAEDAEETEEGDGVGFVAGDFDAGDEAGEDGAGEPEGRDDGEEWDGDGDEEGGVDGEGLDADGDDGEGLDADGDDDADGLGLPDGGGQCFVPGGHDGDAARGGAVQGCPAFGGGAGRSWRQSWSPRRRWIQSSWWVS
jgi:hypothetical protein